MDKESADKKSQQRAEMEKYELQRAEIEKQELLKPFSDGQTWDEEKIKFELQMLSVLGDKIDFEIGKRFIFAKANIPHGRWIPFVESCGHDRKYAALYMHIARELENRPRLKKLGLGVKKYELLLSMDKEDLDDFERGGDLLGKDDDELGNITREALKKELRKTRKRLGQAKEQLADRQEKIDQLQKPIPKETDQFFDELNEMRHVLFHNLERFKKAAMGNMQHEIGVYTVFNIILFHCTYGIRALEDESDFGRFFPGTVPGYDPLALELLNLQELSDEEARKITQFKNAKAEDIKIVGPRHDPEEKN